MTKTPDKKHLEEEALFWFIFMVSEDSVSGQLAEGHGGGKLLSS